MVLEPSYCRRLHRRCPRASTRKERPGVAGLLTIVCAISYLVHPNPVNFNRIHGLWSGPARRPTRSWESGFLPAAVKENLLLDVKEFMSPSEKAWYASKGEYRMGGGS
jgi:hypothetical protein